MKVSHFILLNIFLPLDVSNVNFSFAKALKPIIETSMLETIAHLEYLPNEPKYYLNEYILSKTLQRKNITSEHKALHEKRRNCFSKLLYHLMEKY